MRRRSAMRRAALVTALCVMLPVFTVLLAGAGIASALVAGVREAAATAAASWAGWRGKKWGTCGRRR